LAKEAAIPKNQNQTKKKEKKVQTNFVRHNGEPTVSQRKISHLSWVSEGLRNWRHTQRGHPELQGISQVRFLFVHKRRKKINQTEPKN